LTKSLRGTAHNVDVAKLIRLPRKHAPFDAGLPIRPGDGDLVPVAIILFLASVGRLAAAIVKHEVFRAEATFALLCVIALPRWLVSSLRCSREHRTASTPPLTRADDRLCAEVVPLASRLRSRDRENGRTLS
jgi:hypothetical protein